MSLPGFRIAKLSDYPSAIDCVVDWHHAEWMATVDKEKMSAEDTAKAHHDRKAFMRSHLSESVVPTTFIGLLEDEPIASASLIFHEQENNKRSIWLTNVYVVLRMRKKKLAEIMVQHAMHFCHAHHFKWLQLYTFDAANYYLRRGWEFERTSRIRGRDVDILKVRTSKPFALVQS